MNLKGGPLFKNQNQIEGQVKKKKRRKIHDFFLRHPFESVEAVLRAQRRR